MKKILSSNGLLYVIIDDSILKRKNKNIFSLVNRLAKCDIDIFQYRFKSISDQEALATAKRLAKIIHKNKKIFLINDRADIAYLSSADGVHLGKDEIYVADARKILKKGSIIGKTVHSLKELDVFQKERVDYISFGPVFKTPIKPHLPAMKKNKIKNILKKIHKSVFAIGGINQYNSGFLSDLGIHNVVVCRAILNSKNPKKVSTQIKKCLKKAS